MDPWGGQTDRSGGEVWQQTRKYTTYERDANGSDEAMHRRYNRRWSRFDQADPYDGSYSLTDPQSFNRYSYVQNDPVNFVDPSGLNLSSVNCYLSARVLSRPDNEGGGTISWLDVQWVCVTETWDTGRGGVPGIDDIGGSESPQKPTPPEELLHCDKKVQARLTQMLGEISRTQGSMEFGFDIVRQFNTNSIEATKLYSSNQRDRIDHPPLPAGVVLLGRVHSHPGGRLHSPRDRQLARDQGFTSYVQRQVGGLAVYNPREIKPKPKNAPNCP